MARYRFALRPLWIFSHLFVLAAVVLFISLGFWQLRRLDERRARNAVITSRTAEPVAPVDEVLPVGADYADAEAVAYRTVRSSGTYDADGQVLVRGRSLGGAPGSWVLTPLVREDGTAVIVNRGWVPNSGQLEGVPDDVEVPSGTVTVTGLLLPTEERAGMGPQDPPDGTLTNLARADIARIAEQAETPLVPAYVQLRDQDPEPGAAAPTVLAPPAVDEGPHLSYAAQWFFFAAIPVVGYPIILRRKAEDEERERSDASDQDAPDPHDRLAPDDPRVDAVR